MDILGIDLGTTHSAVGVVESGFPILLANHEGERILPSAVSYQTNHQVFVGKPALRQRALGKEVITSVKRYMGRRFSEIDPTETTAALRKSSNGDIHISGKTPQEVSADILTKLKHTAEQQLERSVSKAVITVPAYFNDAQRNATKQAGELAGLEVVRIVSEPTAAALAYGLDKLAENAKVAVYDLGGGTFDISVLEMREGIFQVLATAGDTRLGGDDIDQAIAEWCWMQTKASSPLQPEEHQKLLDAAREAKEALSETQETAIRIPFFRDDLHIDMALTRQQFETIAGSVIQRTESYCQRVLVDAGIRHAAEDLDAVVLVGGSTRIPAVRHLVARIFGQDPDMSQHPDEAVALGAVIQAGILSGALRQEMVLLDVTPLSLGIETFGGLMNVLIPRNTTIPCKAGEMFTNAMANQQSMQVRVLQGEREMARDNWELGNVDVQFAPAPKAQARVGVQFSIDENGILEVLARDTHTGEDSTLAIHSAAINVDDADVETMVSESVDYAFDDMSERVFTEAKLKAEELLPAVTAGIEQVAENMSAADLEHIQSTKTEVEEALQSGEANTLKAAVQKLDKATEHMAAILVEKAMEAALMKKMDSSL